MHILHTCFYMYIRFRHLTLIFIVLYFDYIYINLNSEQFVPGKNSEDLKSRLVQTFDFEMTRSCVYKSLNFFQTLDCLLQSGHMRGKSILH